MLVVCFPDELPTFVLVEGQESSLPTLYGYMVQLQEHDKWVKSVAGSPILVSVSRNVSVLGRLRNYFPICLYPLTSAIILVASVEAPLAPIVEHHADLKRVCSSGDTKSVLSRHEPVWIFPLS
jgi:hypothetical protein